MLVRKFKKIELKFSYISFFYQFSTRIKKILIKVLLIIFEFFF